MTGNALADAASTLNIDLNTNATWTGASLAIPDVSVGATNVKVEQTSTWTMSASSNVTQTTTNAGLIDYVPPTADTTLLSSYKTLTTQNYVGQTGTLGFSTYLGDDSAPSDRLVINGGSATGFSFLRITNTTGPGALTVADGILVVQVINGGTTVPGAFALPNGFVASGPWTYLLFRGGVGADATNPPAAENWYLRDTMKPEPPIPPGPTPTPTPPNPPFPPKPPAPTPGQILPIVGPRLSVYGVVDPLARQWGLLTLGTLHERIGDTWEPDCVAPAAAPEQAVELPTRKTELQPPLPTKKPSLPTKKGAPGCDASFGFHPSIWGRFFGGTFNDRYQAFADPRANGTFWGFEGGIDLLSGSLILGHSERAGLYAAYGVSDADVTGIVTNPAATAYVLQHTGSTNFDAWTGGGYWTHTGPGGWYLDGVVQGTSYAGHATTIISNLPTDGWGFLASLEAGYPFHVGYLFGWSNLVLEPQAQIVWQDVSFGHDFDGIATIGLGTTTGWLGRLGLLAETTIVTDGGEVWKPYVRGSVWQDWSGEARTTYFPSPVQIPLKLGATWLEFAGGGTVRVNANWSAFGQAGYQFAVAPGGVRRNGFTGDIGVRYTW
jgi:outer membrane autotransporter protein